MYRAYLPKALALTVLAAGITFAGAQQTQPAPDAAVPQTSAPMHGHHMADPQHQAKRLSKELNLTPDQTSKVEPILADRDQKMQALWTNSALAPADRRQQMKTIQQDTEQQMAGVLTPDQLTQLKAMRHHGHHGMHDQGQPPTQSPS